MMLPFLTPSPRCQTWPGLSHRSWGTFPSLFSPSCMWRSCGARTRGSSSQAGLSVDDIDLPRNTVLSHWDAFAFNTMQLGHGMQLYEFPAHVDSPANPATWGIPHRWGLTWLYPHGQEAILHAQADESPYNPFRREPSVRPALLRGVEFVTSQGHTRAVFVRVMHNPEGGNASRASTMFAIQGTGLDCAMRHLVSGANRAMHDRLREHCMSTAFCRVATSTLPKT